MDPATTTHHPYGKAIDQFVPHARGPAVHDLAFLAPLVPA